MTSYARVARVGVFWSYLRQGFAWLLQIPTAIILARLLTPEEFGVAAAASFFVMLSARLTRAGLNTAVIRIKTLRPDHLSTAFVFNVVTSAALCAVLAIGAPYIGAYFRSADAGRAVRMASLSFVITAFATIPMALLRRDMRFREVATLQSAGLLTESFGAVLLAFSGFGFWSIVYGQLAGTLVHTAFAAHYARWKPSLRWSRAANRELFSYGLGTYLKRLLEYAAQNTDNLVVGRMLGVTALGFYDKGFRIMKQVVNRLNAAGPGVSFRIFALIHEEPERFRRAYRKVVLTVTLIAFPIFGGMLGAAPELFVVMFGPRWNPAVLPFRILCVAGMMKLLIEYADAAIQAAGWIWTEVWYQVAYLIMIVLGVAAASKWGLPGAAGAVVVATGIHSAMLTGLLRRATGLGWRDMLEPQVPGLLCAGGMVALVWATRIFMHRSFSEMPAAIVLATEVLVCATFYVSFLWFSRFPEVRNVLRETLSDLSPALARTLKPLV
jgi:PST family polysaccharide transporter